MFNSNICNGKLIQVKIYGPGLYNKDNFKVHEFDKYK